MKAKPVDYDERATREADVDAHCLDAPFDRVEDDDGLLSESHMRDSVNNELLESVRDDPIANVDQLGGRVNGLCAISDAGPRYISGQLCVRPLESRRVFS
jgi:hypothetical protein